MKTFFYLLLMLFAPVACLGQSDFYLATYKMDVYPSNQPKDSTLQNKDPMYKAAYAQAQKISLAKKDVELELYFDKTASLFQLKEKMIPEEEEFFYKMATIMGCPEDTKYYKNIVTKTKIKKTEQSGQPFSVIYPFEQYKWTITDESRMINGYKCYKATASWEEFDYGKEIMLQSTPVVWFTNDIPFPFGPKGLDGLPGLVVEATINGKLYFYLSSLETLNTNKDKFLKAPTEGKNIELNEFLKLIGTEFKGLKN